MYHICLYLQKAEDKSNDFSLLINNSATLGKTKYFQLKNLAQLLSKQYLILYTR